jgi:hypothetical protein
MLVYCDLRFIENPLIDLEAIDSLISEVVLSHLEDQSKGKWVEELPRVVWSHNTFVSRGRNFTPFKLLYGEELVTQKEIKLQSAKTSSKAIYSST